jgi:hypothetical protein
MFSAPQPIAAADQLLPGTMTPEWVAILSEFTRGFKSAASSARNAGAVAAIGYARSGALAVRAAILAVNGYEEGAGGDAHNLGAEHLLPEERALIASLLGDRSDY